MIEELIDVRVALVLRRTMIVGVLLTIFASPATAVRTASAAAGTTPVERSSLVADPPCDSRVAIKSVAANRYVSAELDYAGDGWAMLRARATTIGAWEAFDLCEAGNQSRLWSEAAQRYVSMEFDYGGNGWAMLRARSATHDAWEHFSIESVDGCADCKAIRSTFTGRLVSAELEYQGGDYGMLRARTTGAPGAWEKFILIRA
jgi:hypothetical protein